MKPAPLFVLRDLTPMVFFVPPEEPNREALIAAIESHGGQLGHVAGADVVISDEYNAWMPRYTPKWVYDCIVHGMLLRLERYRTQIVASADAELDAELGGMARGREEHPAWGGPRAREPSPTWTGLTEWRRPAPAEPQAGWTPAAEATGVPHPPLQTQGGILVRKLPAGSGDHSGDRSATPQSPSRNSSRGAGTAPLAAILDRSSPPSPLAVWSARPDHRSHPLLEPANAQTRLEGVTLLLPKGRLGVEPGHGLSLETPYRMLRSGTTRIVPTGSGGSAQERTNCLQWMLNEESQEPVVDSLAQGPGGAAFTGLTVRVIESPAQSGSDKREPVGETVGAALRESLGVSPKVSVSPPHYETAPPFFQLLKGTALSGDGASLSKAPSFEPRGSRKAAIGSHPQAPPSRFSLHLPQPYSPEEDKLILEAVRAAPELRNSHSLFRKLASQLPGRTAPSIRNRYRTTLAARLEYVYVNTSTPSAGGCRLGAGANATGRASKGVDPNRGGDAHKTSPVLVKTTILPRPLKLRYSALEDYTLAASLVALPGGETTARWFYEEFAQRHPVHTASAWRDRYRKFLKVYGCAAYMQYYEAEGAAAQPVNVVLSGSGSGVGRLGVTSPAPTPKHAPPPRKESGGIEVVSEAEAELPVSRLGSGGDDGLSSLLSHYCAPLLPRLMAPEIVIGVPLTVEPKALEPSSPLQLSPTYLPSMRPPKRTFEGEVRDRIKLLAYQEAAP